MSDLVQINVRIPTALRDAANRAAVVASIPLAELVRRGMEAEIERITVQAEGDTLEMHVAGGIAAILFQARAQLRDEVIRRLL